MRRALLAGVAAAVLVGSGIFTASPGQSASNCDAILAAVAAQTAVLDAAGPVDRLTRAQRDEVKVTRELVAKAAASCAASNRTTTTQPATTTTAPPATTTTAAPPATTTTTAPPSTTTTTPPPTTATTQPTTGGTLSLPRIPWEGGPAYWKKYPVAEGANWDDPSFFPFAVYFGKPQYAASLREIGINTYLGAEHDGWNIASMTSTGMHVIAQDEWTAAEINNDPRVVGVYTCDESDMGYCGGGDSEEGRLAALRAVRDRVASYANGRFTFANFGNGVLGTWWMPNLFDEMVQSVDASSVDKYAYTSPHVQYLMRNSPYFPAAANPSSAASYGWLADRMRTYQDPNNLRPNWVFVEAARPYLTEEGAATITGPQLEGAVWSAIIHESRGIAYFEHSNDPVCNKQHSLVECPGLNRETVKRVNAKVQSLAPVINTQSYAYDFNNDTDTMLKTYGSSAYVFAGIGLNETPGSKTFRLPSGIRGTTVTVVGENRTIPVVNGSFTDNFAAEYSHHVYQIAL